MSLKSQIYTLNINMTYTRFPWQNYDIKNYFKPRNKRWPSFFYSRWYSLCAFSVTKATSKVLPTTYFDILLFLFKINSAITNACVYHAGELRCLPRAHSSLINVLVVVHCSKKYAKMTCQINAIRTLMKDRNSSSGLYINHWWWHMYIYVV